MRSEPGYRNPVGCVICHAAVAACHLAERLRRSRKPSPASNDISTVGWSHVVAAGSRVDLGCCCVVPWGKARVTGCCSVGLQLCLRLWGTGWLRL